jgi:hypothetical protein
MTTPLNIKSNPDRQEVPYLTLFHRGGFKFEKSQIQSEVYTNAPYWKKYRASISESDLRKLDEEMELAANELINAVEQNGRLFQKTQVEAYEANKTADSPVAKAIRACDKLRIPFQSVVTEPISPNYSAKAGVFRQMNMELVPFTSLGGLAAYFKKKNKPGKQATLRIGLSNRSSAALDAKQRGVIITIEGEVGNWVATFVEKTDKRIKRLKAYKKSKRDPLVETYLWKNRKHLLVRGEDPIYMEGNHTTLTRQIRHAGYTGHYSVEDAAPKAGWFVSIW